MEAFPLEWPSGWKRTRDPQRARFDTTFSEARDEAIHELELLGAENIIINSDKPVRRDGLPKAGRKEPKDTAMVAYFTLNHQQQCIPCDKWDRTQDNMQAIRKSVEAIRGVARWGADEFVDAAFSGFKALPEPAVATPWMAYFGFQRTLSEADLKEAYVRKAKLIGPPTTENHEEHVTLNKMREETRTAINQQDQFDS